MVKNRSIDSINFNNLSLYSTQKYASIYVYLFQTYKVFKKNYVDLGLTMNKIDCLNAYKKHFSKKILIPNMMYYDNEGINIAYRYRYVVGKDLSDFKIHGKKSVEYLSMLFLKAYKLVLEFHKLDIVLSDVNFSNFIVNNKSIFMLDFDEILIEDFRKGGISWNFFNFWDSKGINFRDFEATKDWDNLSFLIEVFFHIVGPNYLTFDEAENYQKYKNVIPYLESLCSVLKSIYESRNLSNVPTYKEIVERKRLIMTR